jgi:hypothetical protein
MTAHDAVDWTEANQRFMAAELARLKQRLEPDGDASADGTDSAVEEARAALPAPAAIDIVVDLFGLSDFERSLLLLCAGVELDARLAAACARIHQHDGRPYATFGLALGALPDAHWSALTPVRPLRRWRLLEIDPGPRLVDSPVRIDERILHFLAGINVMDARLQPLLVLRDQPSLIADAHVALAERLADAWSTPSGTLPVLHLSGDDPGGQEDVAAAVAARVGLRLFVMQNDVIPTVASDVDSLATLCEREARLLSAALLVECVDAAPASSLSAFVERLTTPVLVAAREPLRLRCHVVSVAVDKPDAAEQKQLWRDALGAPAADLNGSIDALASQFRLSARSIAAIAENVRENGGDGAPAVSELWQACRASGRKRLGDLAERIVPAAGWDDLVLPEPQRATLRQIAAHVRQRVRVHEDWGFAEHGRRGLGISVLFCGESGTGKTLAAEVLAQELALDLYRIDLSGVVSKYIGETEKNLKRVFDAAEDTGSILLFDEADALFGKRSEVKDSHDRYANIEISYLLQRMEAYRGLAVLTTNMKTALDRAFQRRLRFIVNFPFPDAELREAIWRRVFPSVAPLAAVDYRRLARLNVPGGTIRNIAQNAAFLAADGRERVSMGHLLQAAQSESAKLERPLSEAETRGWV